MSALFCVKFSLHADRPVSPYKARSTVQAVQPRALCKSHKRNSPSYLSFKKNKLPQDLLCVAPASISRTLMHAVALTSEHEISVCCCRMQCTVQLHPLSYRECVKLLFPHHPVCPMINILPCVDFVSVTGLPVSTTKRNF